MKNRNEIVVINIGLRLYNKDGISRYVQSEEKSRISNEHTL